MLFSWFIILVCCTPSLAKPAASALQDPTKVSGRDSTSTACAAIAIQTDVFFPAIVAYNCLISVPFNQTVGTQLINYYKDTLQFQSTLAYLKDPTPDYKQSAVDLLGGLDSIQSQIDAGGFNNEYEFETAIQQLVYSAHDTHLSFTGGATAVFSFGSPLAIMSLSLDGVAPPKVYAAIDFVPVLPRTNWTPSALSLINGQDAVEFLTQYAASNSFGMLEPHGDWNQLMYSSAADIQSIANSNSAFTNSPFYPGFENVTFAFENGTVYGPTPWLVEAFPNYVDLSQIGTSDDFYYAFVVKDLFAAEISYVDFSNFNFTETVPPTTWANNAYPKADVFQDFLGSSGFVTGYFLKDYSLGVLSIPNFLAQGPTAASFSDTISQFIQGSKDAGMSKVIIDLQQNNGGTASLATDAFKQFFPSIDPFGGSRFRANDIADTLGNTITNYYNSLPTDDPTYQEWSGSFFSATVYLNAATGNNFTSWAEYFGPHSDHGDLFSTTARKNFSSPVFDLAESNNGTLVYGFGQRPAIAPQPYAAEDIIILTDSLCVSTCALFVEMMHHEAGVRTVVVGGRPEAGPMQAVNGVRGANSWDNESLDETITVAIEINSTTASAFPNRDYDFDIVYAGLNFRDEIRVGLSTPLQFVYEAADCRIWFTPDTVNNFVPLWTYAADAIWKNSSLCVPGSTSSAVNATSGVGVGPTDSEQAAWALTNSTPTSTTGPEQKQSGHSPSAIPTGSNGSEAGQPNNGEDAAGTAQRSVPQCFKDQDCRNNQICKTDNFFSTTTLKELKQEVKCKPECKTTKNCAPGLECRAYQISQPKSQVFWEENLCKKHCTRQSDCKSSQHCVIGAFCDSRKGPAHGFCQETAPTDKRTDCVVSDAPARIPPPPSPTSNGHQPINPVVNNQAASEKTKDGFISDGTMGSYIKAAFAPWQ